MIKKILFFSFIFTLFFILPVHAAYCPSPESIKYCKTLVTKDMVKTTLIEQLKEYNLEKLDNQVVKEITQRINADPDNFFAAIYPLRPDYNPLVLFVCDKLNIDVSSEDNKKIRRMLVSLLDKARKACIYTNSNLNLIGEHAIDLHLSSIKNFEAAFFLSKNADDHTLGGMLTRCSYRLKDGRMFDLIDNEQAVQKPQFKLNGDYRKYWAIVNIVYKQGVYKCTGNSVKNCPFELES
ncbi:MAG: DUF3757 domain-containing protein [Cellulomonas sp.]|nr:DUF3757 domain-containing protein [Rickettsiella sp.]